MNFSSDKKYILILLVTSVILFFPFLGSVNLFDWDEINFAESAREMIVTGDYFRVQINYEPFWEKPPLFFWLIALSMKIFGINEFAARFPNALLGVITLLTFYFIGKRLFNERFGFIWAISYIGSLLPHFYFRTAIIDPWFNYFIFLSLFFFYYSTIKESGIVKYSFYSGLFLGLAILTKGPVALLIVFLTLIIYWAIKKFKRIIKIKNILILLVTAFVISFIWFGTETLIHGKWFIKEFFSYQLRLLTTPDAGHGGPIYYHFLVVLLGCFPISILAIPVLFTKRIEWSNGFSIWMKILFWVVMILFSLVSTKIVHYSSLTYFPLSFLAATYINHLIENKNKISKLVLSWLIFLGIFTGLCLTLLPLLFINRTYLIEHISDTFAIACLQTSVYWSGYEFLIGLVYLFFLIFAFRILYYGNILKAFCIIFFSTAFCIFLYLIVIAPKIETYSQKPAINYFKRFSGQEVYMSPVGYKSYANYFYFKTPPHQNTLSKNLQWLISGNIDKPVYFVTKITNKELEKYPDIKLIEQNGGYALYFRNMQNQKLR